MKSLLFWIVLLATFSSIVLLSLKVSTVTCSINNQTCPETLIDSLEKIKGESLFLTNFDTTIPTLVEDQTIIYTGIAKSLPSTILLTFTTEQPSYLLQSQEKSYIVYQSGLVRSEVPFDTDDTVPSFQLSFPIEKVTQTGSIQPEVHAQMQELNASLYKSGIRLQNSTWETTDEVTLILSTGETVLLSLTDIALQVEKLSILLSSSEIQSLPKEITEIDMRYKFPVLRTAE